MAAAQTCYFPDGSQSPNDTACHSSSAGNGASACCEPTAVCLDNTLCLSQTGWEDISRGTCTDRTWQSPECPHYCADVQLNSGVGIFRVDLDGQENYCCGYVNRFSDTCLNSTKGSSAPFKLPAGRVIFNRTSGSTSSNNTFNEFFTISTTASAAPITVTVTATVNAETDAPSILTVATTVSAVSAASASDTLSCIPSRSSLGKETAIGAGMGAPFGLAFLIMLGLLWRQRLQKQSLKRDVRTLEGKYQDLAKILSVDVVGRKPSYRLYGHGPCEADGGQPYIPRPVNGWDPPDEIDSTQVYEMANKTGKT